MSDVEPVRNQRFNSLTGMRALAALAVAIHHGTAFWPTIPVFVVIGRYGYIGVDFFFCLSGFVMQWAWSRGTNARDFLTRRFSRLYPVIVVSLAISLLAYKYLGNPLAGYVGPPRSVPYNLLMIQSWFFNESTIRQAWNGVTWSLSCEMFFYACSPFLLTRIMKLSARTCALLIGGLFAAYCAAQLLSDPTVGSSAQNFFYYFPPARIPEFIIGALTCQILIEGYRIRFRSVTVAFVAAVLVPLLIYSQLGAQWQTDYTIVSLVVLPGFTFTIMVAACRDMRKTRVKRAVLLGKERMVWLGDVSYSYYMMHALVLGAVGLALTDLGVVTTSTWLGSVWMVLFLALSLLAAWIIWRLVERPGQRVLLHALRRRDVQGQAEAAA